MESNQIQGIETNDKSGMKLNHTAGMDNLAFDPDVKHGDQGIFYITKSASVSEAKAMHKDATILNGAPLESPVSTDEALPNVGEDLTQNENKTETFQEGMRQSSYRSKFIQSLSLSFAFWCFGFQVGQRGPSFLDIQLITNAKVEKASTFFTASSVGYLCGSLISGVLYDRFNKVLLLCLSLAFMAVTVAVLPLCSSYGLMLVILLTNASFMGGLDTAGNARLVSLWGENEGRAFMQAAQFAFAFGGVVSPLVTAPFLAPNTEDVSTNSSSTVWTTLPSSVVLNTTLLGYNITNDNSTLDNNITTIGESVETKLIYGYIISGIVTFLSAIPFMVIYCRYKSQKMNRNQPKKQDEDGLTRDLPWKYHILTIVLLNLFYVAYSLVDNTFAAYLMTFVVINLKWTKAQGTQITSVYWAAFAVSRFLGIFVIRSLQPVVMLFICIAGLTISFTGFLLCSHFQKHVGIWIFAVLVGLSMSIIFPTGFTWAQENLLNITGKVTSLILVAASVGTVINPVIIGYLMEELSPMWYCYLLVGESILCFTIFVVLLFVAKFVSGPKRIVSSSTLEVAPQQAESVNNGTPFMPNNISTKL